MIDDSSTTGPPSTSSWRSSLLGCFGHNSGEKMQVIDRVNSTSRRRRWLSQWSFSSKKSTVKSVHVDFTPTYRKSKSVNETKHVPVTSDEQKLPKHVPVTSEEQKTCRKSWIDVVKGQKAQNGSFRSRRKETKPPARSATGRAGIESPGKNTVTITQATHPCVSSPMRPLTQSKSLPVIKRQKPTKAPAADGGVDKQVVQKTTPSGGEFDSIIAVLILLAIMIIMMIWGKLCAIFCTCAWFLIAPRLVAAGEYSAVAAAAAERRSPELVNNVNLESVEYKKKVVLEGLLQRNHRNVVVGRF